jgi:peptidoglycan/xylan/chitin deacetylase (PgdA/CDA1 family)
MSLGAPTRHRKGIPTGGRIVNLLLRLLHETGLLARLIQAQPSQLTALSYHRIDDPFRTGFDTYRPNVSTTPAGFKMQMEYLRRHYNLVTCEQLALWLKGRSRLPPHAAIISFDDGYLDNLLHAHPVLRELELPATIFLCTNIIGKEIPFYWDQVAYCFAHTRKDSADLPLMGRASWSDEFECELIMSRWFRRVKPLADGRRSEILENLASELDVSIPAGAFSGLYLNWDQVRELSRNGIEMGAHTASHAILTRIPLQQVEAEVGQSKQRIEAEIGKPVISFAYPNGAASDYSAEIMTILSKAGIELAFTLLPGPVRYEAVRKSPLAIRRVFLGYADSFPRFVAKLAGLGRLKLS